MKLGTSSISLSVASLANSMDFYDKLGFEQVAGEPSEGWAILRNGACTIGLFEGMFEGNMLTFNPGWISEEETQSGFSDIRVIQARLVAAGLELEQSTDPDGTGPAHILLRDPDGNAIFLDQHVPAPG